MEKKISELSQDLRFCSIRICMFQTLFNVNEVQIDCTTIICYCCKANLGQVVLQL